MIDKHTRTFTLRPEEVVRTIKAYLRDKYPVEMKETEELLVLKSFFFEETHRDNSMCSVSITAAYQKIIADKQEKS